MNIRVLLQTIILVTVPFQAHVYVGAQEAKEAELIAVLRSDAPKSDKAITCKHLAVHGTKHAVPELAKLLPDPQLTSWARTALEAIPDPSADEALRSAMADIDSSRPLIGVINSVAARQDEQAVAGLVELLDHDDEDVAIAAAIALGKIGTPTAQQELEAALTNESASFRSSIAEACILIAERLLESDQAQQAADLYEKVRTADVPKQRVLEATRGLILARKSVDLLTEQLRSPDKDFFGLGIRTAAELPDQAITDALVAALQQADPLRQSFIVLSLAARDSETVLPAMLRIAQTGQAQARVSALQVLGEMGDTSTVETLLESALEEEAAVSAAASEALATLKDPAVDELVKSRLEGAEGNLRKLLIDTIGSRRIDAVEELLAATSDNDSSLRAAALTALGETVGPHDLDTLVALFTDGKNIDRDVALRAVRAASVRMPDPDACAEALGEAMSGQALETQAALIEVLGRVGGTKALATVARAAADSRDALKDAASQALGKWMTADAAPELLKLAQPKADDKYRIRALRGYLRIARQMKLTDAERAAMCRSALDVAARDAERELAMKVLEIHPSLQTLAVALAAKDDPALRDLADATVLRVAKGIRGNAKQVQDLLAAGGLKPAKIEIVHASYGADDQQKVVTDIVQQCVGELPIVGLKSASYNRAFGGDPAPGVVKRLVVEFKIDGKVGKATFRENEAIILPRP